MHRGRTLRRDATEVDDAVDALFSRDLAEEARRASFTVGVVVLPTTHAVHEKVRDVDAFHRAHQVVALGDVATHPLDVGVLRWRAATGGANLHGLTTKGRQQPLSHKARRARHENPSHRLDLATGRPFCRTEKRRGSILSASGGSPPAAARPRPPR